MSVENAASIIVGVPFEEKIVTKSVERFDEITGSPYMKQDTHKVIQIGHIVIDNYEKLDSFDYINYYDSIAGIVGKTISNIDSESSEEFDPDCILDTIKEVKKELQNKYNADFDVKSYLVSYSF